MEFFRQTSRRTLLLWSVLLSLSLLCGQGVKLHIHNLDHNHGDHLDHTHLSKAHPAHDTSHDNHHDGVVYEINSSPDGAFKNIFNNMLTLALSTFLFMLVLSVPSRQRVHRHRESTPVLYGRYVLSPPLRAPPQ